MTNKADIKKTIANLCILQKNYVMSWPERENIPKYFKELDIEKNEDFALWEMEMTK